ncbi:MAG: SusD/RagB family nutrient-binding outer membrane lipoprotein [Chitinophagaceae bacterium]|nr:SusD/RagB family nutrient-binding outer membrane lipoprotein [Chitinophagaceae bacterium]
MNKIKYLFFLLMGGMLIASCNKQITEKQVDPNNPASVPPRLILGAVLTNLSGTIPVGSLSATGSNEGVNAWDAAHRWNQYHCSNYDYYDNNVYSWSNGSFNSYLVLKNVVQMEAEAVKISLPAINPYEAVGKFIRAYYYYNMTSMFGDIPLGNDLQGLKNLTPVYTSQQKVFQYILSILDTANSHFATLIALNDVKNPLNADQDIYYGGKLDRWQKLVNTFKLRVLISLSGKATDATLNVQAQFASIINNPSTYPIFASADEDLKFLYNPGGTDTYSLYPFNPGNFGSIATRFNMARAYINACTGISDPRVFVTSEPAWALVGNDTLHPAKYQYFAGASTGESLKSMYNNANNGLYSFINRKRYYSNFTGDPNVLVGYNEMCFNIAEAITRGWVTGNAEDWYKKGISGSMAFYGIDVTQSGFNAYFLPPTGSSPSDVKPYPVAFDFNTYYGQGSVKLSSTPATAINQIALQKYIAFFENSGYEAYYNWRRTGVPAFDNGVGVGNNGVVPVRWAYPVSEQTVNPANYKAALTSQGFSADDLNQKLWLNK